MGASRFGELGLIITDSHRELGLRVAEHLDVLPLEVESKRFPNGELDVRRLCDVSGRDICIFSSLHSHYPTVDELRLIVSSIRGSASRVFGVFPFVRSGKSDHIKRFGETVGYKDVADQISSSGLDVIAIFDQHSAQHPFFYNTTHYNLKTVQHVYLMRILIEHAMARKKDFDGVLGLDDGSFKRNKKIAELLGKPVSFIIKDRDPHTRQISLEHSKIVGHVLGQRVVSFDDLFQRGSTAEMGARIAKHNGALSFEVYAVHNDFTSETFDVINPLLEDGTIDKMYTCETVPLLNKGKWHKNLVVIDPSKLLAAVIRTIHTSGHMRDHFLEL